MPSIATALICLFRAAVALTALAGAAQAQGEPVSFAGKQIKLLVGFSPTGYGYDTYARLLARHMGKYLPGSPAIVAQNKPGAGSLNLANYLYNAAAKDGTEIAMVGRGVALEPLLSGHASNALFDATKFVWLGSMNKEVSGFYIRQPGPVATLQEILAGTTLRVGATGAGGDQQVFAAALNSLLGTKLKTIVGYPGTNEILLALERGEIDGIVGHSWGVVRSGKKELLQSGKLKIILQLSLHKHKDLPDIPLVTELTKGDDREVLELIFSRQSMGRPVIAPPGTDARVADALRRAFTEAMHDPQLIAEAARMDLEIDFASGSDVQALVARLYQTPRGVVARAQAIAATN